MKAKVTLACLALVGAGFGADNRMPVEQGVLELGAGVSFDRITGRYDADGDLNEDAVGSSSPIAYGFPVQVKYGVMEGMSVELTLPFLIEEADVTPGISGGRTGMERPELSVKYALRDLGVGAYLTAVIPFGLGDFADNPSVMRLDADAGEPGAAVAAGALYDNVFAGSYRVAGALSYHFSIPNGDAKKSDVVTVIARPEYLWDANVGSYVGLRYDYATESVDPDGETEAGSDGYLFTVSPGMNLRQNERVAYDVRVPITLAGENRAAYWGLNAAIRVNLPL